MFNLGRAEEQASDIHIFSVYPVTSINNQAVLKIEDV